MINRKINEIQPMETDPEKIREDLLTEEESVQYKKFMAGEIDYETFLKNTNRHTQVESEKSSDESSSNEALDDYENDPDFSVPQKKKKSVVIKGKESEDETTSDSSGAEDDEKEDAGGLGEDILDPDINGKVAALFTDEYASTIHSLRPSPQKTKSPSVLRLSRDQTQFLSMAEKKLNENDYIGAIEICNFIIEQCPGAPETYLILSDIYYRQGNIVKSKDYMLKAAHRRPSEASFWLNLVNLCEELKDDAAAHFYLYKAVRMSKYEPELTNKLIKTLQDHGKTKEILHLKLFALRHRPNPDINVFYADIKELFNGLMEINDQFFAVKALTSFFNQHPEHGKDEDRLNLLKIYWKTFHFDEMIRFSISNCGLKIFTKQNFEVQAKRARFHDVKAIIDPNRQIEFGITLPQEVKLYILLIVFYYEMTDQCESHIRRCLDVLEASNIELMIKLASVAIRRDSPKMAIYIAERLIKEQSLDMNSTLWCIIAKSQSVLGQYSESMKTFEHLIKVVNPQCLEARLELGTLYQRFNKNDEAYDILQIPKPKDREQSPLSISEMTISKAIDESREQVSIFDDPGALKIRYERCRMLALDKLREKEFLEDSWSFLFGELTSIIGNSDNRFIFAIENLTRTQEMLRKKCPSLYTLSDLPNEFIPKEKMSRTYKKESLHPNEVLSSGQITGQHLWEIYEMQKNIFLEKKNYELLFKATLLVSLMPYAGDDDERRKMTSSLLISLGIILGVREVLFDQIKNYVHQWRDYNQFWNVINYSIQVHRGSKYAKYFSRIYDKRQKSENLALAILLNNDSIHRGSIRYAIISLATLRNRYPDNAYISLALGSCYLNLSLHKHIVSRHPYIVQAFGFLNEYSKKRGPCPEVYFNMARACHQILLNDLAIHFYLKVLETEPVGQTEEEKHILDIRLLAAYNLYHLYLFINSEKSASFILNKYLVI